MPAAKAFNSGQSLPFFGPDGRDAGWSGAVRGTAAGIFHTRRRAEEKFGASGESCDKGVSGKVGSILRVRVYK